MATQAPTPGLTYFSTAGLEREERFAYWREMLDGVYRTGIDIRQPAPEPFFASVRTAQLLHANVFWGRYGATLNRMQKEPNDDLELVVNLDGLMCASQLGTDVRLARGDAFLMTRGELRIIDRPTAGEHVGVRVRRADIAPFLRPDDGRPGRFIPGGSAEMRLLTRYVRLLDESEPLYDPRTLALVTGHVHDLLMLALGARGDARDHASNRGLRAAQIKAIKAYVEQNLALGNLSPETLAPKFGLSARTIQRLFEREGATFSEFLRERRLQLARRMLASPRFARSSVARIALDAGFGDISHFNRMFRRRFGLTPTDFRGAH